MKLFKLLTKKTILAIMAIIVIGVPLLYLTVLNQKEASAWFDENWNYRAAVPISAHTSAENNVYITVTIDTATPITTGKMQSDCGDLRFTKENGELLPYFINASPGCNNAATTIQVNFDSFPAGAQTIYYYYGNTSAVNGFNNAGFSTAATGATIGSVGSEAQGPGPVGYWKFDDGTGTNANDSTSNNLDGTLGGSVPPAWKTEDQCISGKCLYFDGSAQANNGKVTVNESASTPTNITGDLTISTWIKPTANFFDNPGYFIRNGQGADEVFAVQYDYTNKRVNFDWYDGTFKQVDGATNGVPLNQWSYIQITRSGTTLNIYVNGKLNATGTVTTPTPQASSLSIGQTNNDAVAQDYTGFIDEVKIYNYARTAAQIKTDYNSRGASAKSGIGASLGAKPQDWISNGLVGYWKMDETSGTSVADSSGNANTGTLTNAQEAGTATDVGTTTTLVDTVTSSLSTTDSVYNGMILHITGSSGGTCAIIGSNTGTDRLISAYNGTTKTITVANAFNAVTQYCTYEIRHQTGGKYGESLKFDGIDDYVDATNNSTLDFNATQSFTISAWVKSSAASDSTIRTITQRWATGGTTYPYVLKLGADNQWHFIIWDGTNAPDIGSSQSVDTNWHHIVGVRDITADKLYLYVDGLLVNSTTDTTTGSISNATASTKIGTQLSSAGFWKGSLDEARIYNRALSPKEVSDLYNWEPGPVGYYKMDDKVTGNSKTLIDSSGYGNNATTVYGANATGMGCTKVGKYGGACQFDGTDDYAYKQSVSGIYDAPLTMEAWVYPQSSSDSYMLEYGVGGGAPDFDLRISSSKWNYVTNGVNSLSSTSSVALNRWTHVAATMDSNFLVSIYVNGILEGTKTITESHAAPGSNNDRFYIGSRSAANYFQGMLDEVKVYSYARTQKQIVSDMNAGHPAVGSPVGSAVGYWKFDEGYGTTANDSTPNTNSLTLSSASWTDSGKFGKAWNGTGALWLSRADDSDFDVTATDDYAVSLWFKSDSATNPGAAEYLFNKASATIAGYAIYANTSGNLCFGIDDDTSWGPDVASCTSTDVYDGTWHHVIGIRDTVADKTLIYVDGVLQDSDTDTTTATLANSLSLYIGDRDGVDNGDEFNGDLDEIKVYRYALTADDVKTEYNRGSSMVLGALGSNSTYQPQAANQEYCVPGDTTSCAAPVGRWDFEEGTGTAVNDTSGNGYTGTITGATWKPGKSGKGLYFDGNSYVTVGNQDSLDPKSGDFTFEFWLKTNNTSRQVFFTKGWTDWTGGGWGIGIQPGGQCGANNLCFTMGDGNDSGRGPSVAYTSYADNKWHHISGVYTRATNNTAYIYIDGVQKASADLSSYISGSIDNNIAAYIGALATDYPTAYMDQIRYFNYARSAAQVAWDYNRGKPVGHWKLDECQGTSANDSSGNGNNGTITVATGNALGTCTTASTFWGGSGGTGAGKRNYAPTFDGTDDYVDVANESKFDFTGAFTLSAWIKPSGSDTYNGIIGKYDGSASGWDLILQDGKPRLALRGTGNFDTGQAGSNSDLRDGTWHHVDVVVNSTSSVSFYLDGSFFRTVTGTWTPTTNNTDVVIGDRTTGNLPFRGQIDDVRVFNYALTAAQVKDIYNGGAVNFGPSTGSP